MKVLELLASQLDREATDTELKATQHTFSTMIEFWGLCMEAKRMLLDIEQARKP